MKVYQIRGSSGSWDSFYTYTIGIAEFIEKAEEMKECYIKEINRRRKLVLSPLNEEQLQILHNLEEGWNKLDDIYSDWRYKNRELLDINLDEITIREFTLNYIEYD